MADLAWIIRHGCSVGKLASNITDAWNGVARIVP